MNLYVVQVSERDQLKPWLTFWKQTQIVISHLRSGQNCDLRKTLSGNKQWSWINLQWMMLRKNCENIIPQTGLEGMAYLKTLPCWGKTWECDGHSLSLVSKSQWPVSQRNSSPFKGCRIPHHRMLNSASLCIFLTLLHQSEENHSTNIPHPLTQTFCKPPCDWLINIPHPTEPEESSAPFGAAASSPYRACWKCFLKQKIHHSLGPKGDETNSAGIRGWGISLWNSLLVMGWDYYITNENFGGVIPLQIQFQVSALVSEESMPICWNLL